MTISSIPPYAASAPAECQTLADHMGTLCYHVQSLFSCHILLYIMIHLFFFGLIQTLVYHIQSLTII